MDAIWHGNHNNDGDYRIVDYAPFVDKAPIRLGVTKNKASEAFDNLVAKMNASVTSCAAALLEGGVLDSEKEDW